MQSRLLEAEIATFGRSKIVASTTSKSTSPICRVAREIAACVKQEMLYPGTAPNELLAKSGSELDKPERLAFLTSHDLEYRYSPGFSIWRRFLCSPWNPNANGGIT
ncbi:hypothetical protein VSR69_36490 [Paraburkholderia phytofirmans]|jgi:hypothetical protein|uniref:hypothetical protein n=1 Tax=Paraburkholderia sp. BL9I2N2 TaxID=1938809 RepID=UPI001051CE94|nr:hypothetical protein [Paraburkholderia sp. BL9I2N2]